MKIGELKALILSLIQDVTFEYEGEYACINPYHAKKIEIGYGDIVKIYESIEEAMEDKIFHGKALKDICEFLQID